MAEKKVGALVKEARTAAKLTQEKLAKAAGENLTAADISKCEQGKADLTTAQLKKIAVACGVTQASLVNAPKNISASAAKKTASKTAAAKASSSGKETAAKSSAAKKTTAKTSAAKTSSKTSSAKTSAAKTAPKASSAKTSAAKSSSKASSAKKKEPAVPASANVSMKVTSTEQKLIQAYRGSTSDRKKAALKLLNGEYGDTVDKLLSVTNGTAGSSSSSSSPSDAIGDMLGNVLGSLLGGK